MQKFSQTSASTTFGCIVCKIEFLQKVPNFALKSLTLFFYWESNDINYLAIFLLFHRENGHADQDF